jgi:trimeric autotransporter adhesin
MNNLKFQLKTFGIISMILLSCIPQLLNAQSIGIGTLTPNGFSALDISSSNKGLLIPRMALTSTTSNAPIGAFVAGMMVYNTATTGDVTPGFYLCNGTKWEKAGGGWTLTGNSGTNPSTNFIGTTDDQDIVFKRNNVRAGLINVSRGSVSLGSSSLSPSATGIGNTVIGHFSMSNNGSGAENSVIGHQALRDNTTGSYNTGLGSVALINNTTGSSNIGIGFYALQGNRAGNDGIAIGNFAQYYANNTTTPFSNTNIAIGNGALQSSTTPANNTGLNNNVIGYTSMYLNSTGSRNNSLGTQSLYNNTTGSANIAIGHRSLFNNTTKSGNTAVGDSTLHDNGIGAVFAEDATFNTAIGSNAMKSNSTGFYGTAVGYKALMKNTTGRFNTAVGHGAMQNLTTHSSANSAFGQGALFNQTGGSGSNTGIGAGALNGVTTGGFNTGLGYRAGFTNQGEKNIFIGSEAGYYETESNKLFIENSNADSTTALIYGNFSSNKLRINDKLGIGIIPVSKALEIRGSNSTNELMQFYTNAGTAKWHMNILANGSLNFVETDVADQRFVIRPGGFVTIGEKMATGYRLSVDGKIAAEEVLVDLDADWPDYVFKSDYKLKSLEEVKAHIQEKGHLPNVPSAKEVQENGILLGNMNKVLMEKIEELTLYILQQEERIKKLEEKQKK